MIRFIRHKIQNKKWLNSCLLIGVALLSAFLCIYPMFREGSLNRLLQTLFTDYIEEKAEYPTVIARSDNLDTKEYKTIKDILDKMDEYEKNWCSYLIVPALTRQQVVTIFGGNAEATFGDKTKQITLGYIPNLYEHTKLVYGTKAEEAAQSENELVKKALKEGAYPCVLSQYVMDKYRLVIGETLSFRFHTYSEEEETKFVVTGFIEEKESTDLFWHNRLKSYDKMVWITENDFNQILAGDNSDTVSYDEVVLLDYTKIRHDNAKDVDYYIKEFKERDSAFTTNFASTLSMYGENEKTVNVILFTFELPIIALLLLFLYMISGQILEMETTEIAMLKSRGVSRKKIVLLYILQSAIISGFGMLIGLPLGYTLCKLGAGTNGFLVFTIKDVAIYQATLQMLPFSLLAFVLAVLFMTIPVIKISTLTITERKSRKIETKEKPAWEKYFIDLLLLVVSGYLLFNYYKQSNTMAAQIIAGESVDPVMFLDSSLFILSCGLVCLRLIHYLVRLIYHIGRKKWKPASYVSFLQIMRSVKKQGFIAVFLVMTISIGVFNANLARTINENMEQRISYQVGADVVTQEKWSLRTKSGLEQVDTLWAYVEPDPAKYNILKDIGVEQATKVITDNNIDITISDKVEKGNTLMAINTKEFGETARLKDGVNDKHWFNYLNELAKDPEGVIISSNLARKYNLKVGDIIYYTRYSPVIAKKELARVGARVCGIVDAFPGYVSTDYVTLDNGEIEEREHYLLVANYATVVDTYTITPYSMWMRLSDGVSDTEVISKMEESGIEFAYTKGIRQQIQNQRDSALLQITNGMFSVGFIISLLICGVGFLIYWILTIRKRELIYGIYRAMGMSMREIVGMLIIEQIFSSLLAAIVGFFVGNLTTFLFTKLIAIAYLPRKFNFATQIYILPQDSIKMVTIVALVFIVCFVVIRRIVKNMNITKGLKMGED